jgi:hypothetical protein
VRQSGTGRDKIETEKQLLASRVVCENLALDGLVIIGTPQQSRAHVRNG